MASDRPPRVKKRVHLQVDHEGVTTRLSEDEEAVSAAFEPRTHYMRRKSVLTGLSPNSSLSIGAIM